MAFFQYNSIKWSVFFPQHYLFLDQSLQWIAVLWTLTHYTQIIVTIQNSEFDSVFSVHIQYDKSWIISDEVRHIVPMSQSLDSELNFSPCLIQLNGIFFRLKYVKTHCLLYEVKNFRCPGPHGQFASILFWHVPCHCILFCWACRRIYRMCFSFF